MASNAPLGRADARPGNMEIIEVIDGGLLTTVQDRGRYGYQRYGVPVSGAVDQFAYRVANHLVGNGDGAAGLEITLIGPRLRFLGTTVIALAGADLSPQLDEEAVPMWGPVAVPAGAALSFGEARDGVRTCLAIRGGLDVPVVLGSRATHVRSRLGGFGGRPLQAGDGLATPDSSPPDHVAARRFPPEQVPIYGHRHALRVVLGPQDSAFTPHGVGTLLSSTYIVSAQSDRIGCRLQGPAIEHATSPDIVSDGIPCGAIQVAGDGLPIVLLADRGTTGGYTKIATVITVDVPRLAQAGPGDTVTFAAITVDEAHELLRQQEALLLGLGGSAPVRFARRRFHATVDGVMCEVAGDLAELPEPPVEGGERAPRLRATARVTGGHVTRACEIDIHETDQ